MAPFSTLLPTLKSTTQFARRLASALRPGDVLVLSGDLGSGKTTLTTGLGRAFGIRSRIVSPTFTLRKSYAVPRAKNGIHWLHHCDLYRLPRTTESLRGLLEETFPETTNAVWVIEWGGRLRQFLPRHTIELSLAVAGVTSRRLTLGAATSPQALPRMIPLFRPRTRPGPPRPSSPRRSKRLASVR